MFYVPLDTFSQRQVKIGLHQLDNCLSQVKINAKTVNNRVHEAISLLACNFAKS